MKQVFNKQKAVASLLQQRSYTKAGYFVYTNRHETAETLELIHGDWMSKCEGKTEEEINALGLFTRPEFMEEI